MPPVLEHRHVKDQPKPDHQRPLWIIIFAIFLIAFAMRAKAEDVTSQQLPGQEVLVGVEAEAHELQSQPNVVYGDAGDVAFRSEALPAPDRPVSVAGDHAWSGQSTASESTANEVSGNEMTQVELNGVVYSVRKSSAAIERDKLWEQAYQAGQRSIPPQRARRSRPHYATVSAAPANFDADAGPDGWMAEVVVWDREDRPTHDLNTRRATANFELLQGVPPQGDTGDVAPSTAPVTWTLPLGPCH